MMASIERQASALAGSFGDGNVDVADLLAVIAAWNSCP